MNKPKSGVRGKRKQTSDGSYGHQWTDYDQKRLEELIKDGTLSLTDSSVKVKDMDETFDKFSNSVIGYHLGLLRKNKSFSSSQSVQGPVEDVLSQVGAISSHTLRLKAAASDMIIIDESYTLFCDNMPFVRFNFMDYDSKQEKIVILIDLPGGSGNYNWEFNDIGDSITLYVEWSKALCDVSNLFRKELQSKSVTLDHPKLHAMQRKRVHKDDGTWDADVVQHEGNKILYIEFSGFQEEILKKVKSGCFRKG